MISAVGILSALLSGAGLSLITNLFENIFGLLKSYERRKVMKLEHEQSLEIARIEADIRKVEAETEADIKVMEIDGSVLRASYEHASASTARSYSWVASILSLVRPVLTFVMVGYGYMLVMASEDPALKASVTVMVVEMTAMIIAWWFGDRSFKRARGS